MSKCTVSKQEYEEALATVSAIESRLHDPQLPKWIGMFTHPEWLSLRDEYTVAQQRISYYVLNHAHGLSNSVKKYLVTFTYDPKKDNSKAEFKTAVIRQLNRSWEYVQYAFEHEDTNIHCHAIISTRHRITGKNFDSHQRKYGHVDVRLIKIDNGLEDYISKESQIIVIEK